MITTHVQTTNALQMLPQPLDTLALTQPLLVTPAILATRILLHFSKIKIKNLVMKDTYATLKLVVNSHQRCVMMTTIVLKILAKMVHASLLPLFAPMPRLATLW
jgi:hypothetical protein